MKNYENLWGHCQKCGENANAWEPCCPNAGIILAGGDVVFLEDLEQEDLKQAEDSAEHRLHDPESKETE